MLWPATNAGATGPAGAARPSPAERMTRNTPAATPTMQPENRKVFARPAVESGGSSISDIWVEDLTPTDVCYHRAFIGQPILEGIMTMRALHRVLVIAVLVGGAAGG